MEVLRQVRGYELLERIASGGFGSIYRAYQPTVGREVAIKLILPTFASNPDFIRRFEAEAQVVARLEHPFIVPLFDYWRDPDGAFLVMRLLRGGTLRTLMTQGRLPTETLLRVLDQIAGALGAAHRFGVVHRDLKPENILLDEAGNAYLSDFGIAQTSHDKTEQGLFGSPAYISPEQIRSEVAAPQSDIYSLGILLYELLAGQPPFNPPDPSDLLFAHLRDAVPDITRLRPDLPPAVDAVIQRATAKDPQVRYESAQTLALDLRRALGGVYTAPTVVSSSRSAPNPYKGLRPFSQSDSGQFYGRAALVERLLGRLLEDHPLAGFLALVGASGSGKSSVVKAGLIPALRRGDLPGSEHWFIAEMLPGREPLTELRNALLSIATQTPADMMDSLRRDAAGLTRVVGQILPAERYAEVLLVIDQFEELFTLADRAEAEQLMILLEHAAARGDARIRIVITLRADFYDRPLVVAGFSELMRQRTEVVTPLTQEELRDAIVLPAAAQGVNVEAELVSTMLADVQREPGALPLLQYALTDLFDRRSGNLLTLAAYRANGGVAGALAARAEAIYISLGYSISAEEHQQRRSRVRRRTTSTSRALMSGAQLLTRQLFLRLVAVGDGVDDARRDARRRALWREIMSLAKDRAEMERVLEMFGASRLLTFDNDPTTREPTIEVAHEALLREWERLREWLEESREDLRMQRRLGLLAGDWLIQQRDESLLLRGTALVQFETWRGESDVALTEQETEYLNVSTAARAQETTLELERQTREVRLQRQSRVRLQALVIILSVGAVLAAGLALFAVSQSQAAQIERDNAQEAARLSRGLALAASAQQALGDDDSALALTLALEANLTTPELAQNQFVLAEAAYAPGAQWITTLDFVPTAFAQTGAFIAAGGTQGELALFDADGLELWRKAQPEGIVAIGFSAEGTRLFSGERDGTLIMWDVQTGAEMNRFTAAGVSVLAALPDGERLLLGSSDGWVELWSIVDGAMLRQIPTHGHAITSLTVDSRGVYAVVGDVEGHLELIDIAQGLRVREYLGHSNAVVSVRFSPDNRWIASASFDRTARLWEASAESFAAGEEIARLIGHTSGVRAVAFSPDGRRLLSASADATIWVWDVDQASGTFGDPLVRLVGQSGTVLGVGYDQDGRSAYSVGEQGRLIRWDTLPGWLIRRVEGSTANALSLNPATTRLASGGQDAVVRVWDSNPASPALGEQRLQLSGHSGQVAAVAFAPDGRSLASGGSDGTVRLWDAMTGDSLGVLRGHTSGVTGLAFSADSALLLSGSSDRSLLLWDVASGGEIRRFGGIDGTAGHTAAVQTVALSPDGAWALSGSRDNTLILWDVTTGALIRQFNGHTDQVTTAVFSPDGALILSASYDQTLRLWDATTGAEVRRFNGHTDWVRGAAFTRDGAYVLSSGSDGTVRVWDTATGAEVRRFTQRGDTIAALAVGSDMFAFTSREGGFTLARLDTPDEIVSWARENRAPYELSCPERERYQIEPFCDTLAPQALPTVFR